MKIWVDLGNSPQVLFFRPLIASLKEDGHNLKITTRDYAQTVNLANDYDIEHTIIGEHGGKDWSHIFLKNSKRIIDLIKWAYRHGPFDLAVSHNSYTQAVAARLLGIPFVTLMDYEYQKLNHLCFRLAKKVIVPEPFPDEMLKKFGAYNKAKKYDGLKEQMYLYDFKPKHGNLEKLHLTSSKIFIVMRPPATWATYHRFKNNLFDMTLDYLANLQGVQIIFLPRIKSQGDILEKKGISNIYIPKSVIDGPNLLYAADIVISGGGTMNREAAVLGTPAYTLFKGKLGSVDKYLIERGRLYQIKTEEDIKKIKLEKSSQKKSINVDSSLVNQIKDFILG